MFGWPSCPVSFATVAPAKKWRGVSETFLRLSGVDGIGAQGFLPDERGTSGCLRSLFGNGEEICCLNCVEQVCASCGCVFSGVIHSHVDW